MTKYILTDCDCSEECNKLQKSTKYCGTICANHTTYFDCQAKCVNTGADTPQNCIRDSNCKNNCDKRCEQLLPGNNKDATYSNDIESHAFLKRLKKS